jgi:hypothetical protein
MWKNKANTNPIPEMSKMNVNSLITKDYRKNDAFAVQKTNPIQTQSNPISRQSSINHSFFQMNSNHCDVGRGNTTYPRSLSKRAGPKG